MRFDVLIIGTGIAGLYSALQLDEDLKILIISKRKWYESNSYLAQSGISNATNENNMKRLMTNTLKAGEFKNNINAVKILTSEAKKNINQLVKLGVSFDNYSNGKFNMVKNNSGDKGILRYKDRTGRVIVETLWKNVIERENITVMEDAYATELIVNNNRCNGAFIKQKEEYINIAAKIVILATGGIGGLFKSSTNESSITGDGLTLAYMHNIILKDLNLIQFHPTALYVENHFNRRLLISEVARREGAKLYNTNGKRFIDETLPRNKVTNAIIKEMHNSEKEYVFLDLTYLDEKKIMDRFPAIYENCIVNGINPSKQMIPISPCQHYHMGGIETDLFGRTSMEYLFAVGEVSCSGIHGVNRFVGNSLLECIVFGNRAAKLINIIIKKINFCRVIENQNKPIDKDIENKKKKMAIHILQKNCKLISKYLCTNKN